MKKSTWASFKHINIGLSFGLSLIFYLLFGFFGGTWLDNRFGTTPTFLVVGLALAGYLIYREFEKMIRVLEDSRRLEANMQESMLDKEEQHRRRVAEAKESLSHARSLLTDFEEMVAEKERQALRRIRGEKDEDIETDSRGEIKKY
ncbi:MAG: hypothetical protein GX058_02065 [Firmicutes bacterium]|nr:hypothetical protein [Bacillota bacterium]